MAFYYFLPTTEHLAQVSTRTWPQRERVLRILSVKEGGGACGSGLFLQDSFLKRPS